MDAAHDLLFGVSWADTWVLASFIPIMAIVALFGCLVPTLRAARVEPMQVLRMNDE